MRTKIAYFSDLCNKYDLHGLDFQYYHVCHTRLYYNKHNLLNINENNYISKGKAYSDIKEDKEKIKIMGLKPDKIDFINKIIVENKISNSFIEATTAQLMFYVIMMNSNYKDKFPGEEKIYFLEDKNSHILLEIADHIDNMILIAENIIKILNCEIPVSKKKNVCDFCAYNNYCFV